MLEIDKNSIENDNKIRIKKCIISIILYLVYDFSTLYEISPKKRRDGRDEEDEEDEAQR